MVLSFSMVGFAQTSTGGQMGTMSSEQHLVTYKGKIVSFNDTDHTLVVNGKQGDKTFDLSRVTLNGALTPGSKVKVSYYTDTNGNLVVSSIKGGGMHHAMNQYGTTQQYGTVHGGQYGSNMGYSDQQYSSSDQYGYGADNMRNSY